MEITRPGNHRPDGPEVDHALTIKLDHSVGPTIVALDPLNRADHAEQLSFQQVLAARQPDTLPSH
jgi:hypothetical protein